MAIRPPILWNVHVCLRLYVHVFYINFSHITEAVNVSYTAALQTCISIKYLLKTLIRISRREKIISTKLYKGSNSWLMNPPPPPPHTHTPSRVVHRSQTINILCRPRFAGPRKSVLKLYAHNITDAMDNKIVTHFMQLNAEWSFYGSLVIFRQELVILTDLKYPCLYIVGFRGRGNLL